MNILIMSWRDPKHPLAGGAEQVVLQHAKGWIESGNNVTWLSSRFPKSLQLERFDGIDFVRMGHQYLGVQILAPFYYLKNKNKYDMVIDQFHGIPFFTPLYVKKPKIALIQEVAGKVWLLNPLVFPINLIVGVVGLLIEPLVFLLYKNTPFMTGSESAKKEVSKFGIPLGQITVVPHGVILPRRKYKHSYNETPVVTYLGILSKDKGVEDVLKCFAELDRKQKYVFWIIGKPETQVYYKRLKKLVKKLNLNQNLKFWGYVSQEQKYELLSKSSVLVNPSVHEGWGLVNIEANVVGTPVVSYRSAGLVDSVKDGQSGLILDLNTPDEMANVVDRLVKNRELYKKLNTGSVKWSMNFSWSISKRKSLDLINKIA